MDLKDKIELLKKQEREKTVKIACADKLFALVNSNKKTLGKRPLSFEEINILLENAESVDFIMPKTGEYIEIVEDEEEFPKFYKIEENTLSLDKTFKEIAKNFDKAVGRRNNVEKLVDKVVDNETFKKYLHILNSKEHNKKLLEGIDTINEIEVIKINKKIKKDL